MQISVRWLNALVPGTPLPPEEVERLLMGVGFPIETREPLPGGDTRLDVEITSNRGDCLCHAGLAREIAAKTGRTLTLPTVSIPGGTGRVEDVLKVENREVGVCPLFTARVVRGVKIGPSPAWLRERLEAVGQRSINNVVDATNYVNFELGQPTHAFDLKKLAGGALVIRWAREGEKLTTLDGKARVLKSDELVVADSERAQSLAGVIGGQDAEVTDATTDVVLEAATWDPVTVRRAARRLQVRTDASHRFERTVDARTIRAAADRLAQLVVEVAGGTLCEGIIEVGREPQPLTTIRLRPKRCRDILGYDVSDARMADLLRAHGIGIRASAGAIDCEIPPHRVDLTREIDLIEEVARTEGLDRVPLLPKLPVTVRGPQESERAMRELVRALTALGFSETVTFSFVRPGDAALAMPAGAGAINVDDDRRGAEPTLRPSLLPSLLQCRRANQDGNVSAPGGVRLFEAASVFGTGLPRAGGPGTEKRVLAMISDVPGEGAKRTSSDTQTGVRLVRGAIDTIVRALRGAAAGVEVRPGGDAPGLDPRACAAVSLRGVGGAPIGAFGVVSRELMARFGLEIPVIAAELDLDPLLALYPPRGKVTALPAFPAIERDLSLVLDEGVEWARVEAVTAAQSVHLMEGFSFVYTYRGKPLAPGTKSVTVRLRFREESRTLRHEEVDPQVAQLVAVYGKELGATLRA